MSELRFTIRPFPRVTRYPTGWAGELSFAEIHADLIPNMNRLLRYYRKPAAYIPDILQEGFMRLWWDLCQEPDMLAKADKGDALRMVLDRTRTPSFVRKSLSREVYLEDLATRSGDPDEFVIEGYEGRFFTEHSEFARAIDLRIDFERVIQQMAEKYMDSLPHLAALYYITTEVGPDDAAAIAGRSGTKKCWWLTSVVKPMREELAEQLELFKPQPETWRDRHLAGIEAPLLRLVTRYQAAGNLRMAATVQSMGAYESCKTLVERLGLPQSTIHMLRRNAHKALNKAYGCSA